MTLVALDCIAAPVISTLVLVGCTKLLGMQFTEPYVLLAVFSALLSFVFVRQESKQQRDAFVSGWTIATRTAVAWLFVVAALLLIGYATKVSAVYSRRALFLWFLATPPALIAATITLRKCVRRVAIASGNVRSVVVAGVNGISLALAETLRSRPELGLELEGFFEDRCLHRVERAGGKILGSLTELPAYARLRRVDIIFVGIPYYLERTKELLRNLRDTTASVYLIPDISFIDVIQSRAEDICGIPIIALCETPFQGWSGFKKRAMDVILGAVLLLIALPFMAMIAAAVKLTSPGSVLFKQRRYGLDGDEILVYKFRTMYVSEDGDGVRQATRDDPRVTPIGRFLRRYSLDELPQLINVLQGRMSLVGPRPHAVAHNEEYRKLIDGYMVRHKVSPGITGLAQVNGCRGETADLAEMQRRIEYDLDYLRHWSLMLDTKILVKTVCTLFMSEKAY
ncbi:MAG TPA: undecaprenyl-phosphate glucose phosphotransferase [Gammaproteobacteria bacterium]|nr:undecaprenyl-phosphate glucose phosphotransferase [Gammaproteobacteria bacterium]